jgi:hypothetical protein
MAGIQQPYDELQVVNAQIDLLVQRRQEIFRQITVIEKISTMRKKADIVADIIKDISSVKSPIESLLQVNCRLTPWRHNLSRDYFENTLIAIPECLPSNWTRAQAADFFASLTKALEEDVAALEATCADE